MIGKRIGKTPSPSIAYFSVFLRHFSYSFFPTSASLVSFDLLDGEEQSDNGSFFRRRPKVETRDEPVSNGSSTTRQNGVPNVHVIEAGNPSTHWLNLARNFFSSTHKVG